MKDDFGNFEEVVGKPSTGLPFACVDDNRHRRFLQRLAGLSVIPRFLFDWI
jgi:hypothetical protein